MSPDTPTIAQTFKDEVIWTETEVGYLSRQHVPDSAEALKVYNRDAAWDIGDEEPDECYLRWANEAERKETADEHGLTPDEAEAYFQECSAAEGEPFWKVEL